MNFLAHIENIEDSRQDINKSYNLVDMLFLSMSAVLSGAQGWTIKFFGDAKLDWLRQFRPFENGIPTRKIYARK